MFGNRSSVHTSRLEGVAGRRLRQLEGMGRERGGRHSGYLDVLRTPGSHIRAKVVDLKKQNVVYELETEFPQAQKGLG